MGEAGSMNTRQAAALSELTLAALVFMGLMSVQFTLTSHNLEANSRDPGKPEFVMIERSNNMTWRSSVFSICPCCMHSQAGVGIKSQNLEKGGKRDSRPLHLGFNSTHIPSNFSALPCRILALSLAFSINLSIHIGPGSLGTKG